MPVSYDLHLRPWLRKWGFFAYPFELYEAERELDQVELPKDKRKPGQDESGEAERERDQVELGEAEPEPDQAPKFGPILSLFFINQPYFYTVLGNPTMPQTAFLLAKRGFGKTATRAMVDHKCRFGSYSGQVIVANYTDFGPLLRRVDYDLDRLTAYDHVHMILRSALAYLRVYVNPDHWVLPVQADRQLLANFVHTYADPITRLKVSRELDDSPVPFDWSELSAYEILELFVGLIVQMEHQALYVLIDCVDEFPGAADDPGAAARVLLPLVADQGLMNMPKVAFKFFLPDTVGDELVKLTTIRHDRWSWEAISWDRETLSQLVQERLSYYSHSEVVRFEDLCSADISQTAMDRLIRVCRGSPRVLLRLCDAVVQQCVSRGERDLYIKYQDVRAVVSNPPDWVTAAEPHPIADRSADLGRVKPPKKGLWLDQGTVWVDGVRLESQPSPQELKLFEYLYLRQGEVVSVEELIQAVWGPFATERDAPALRKLIGRLRERLGPNQGRFIRNERGRGYSLKL